MEILQLIVQLEKPKTVPVEAINELMARKDESTPALLDVLTRTLDDYKRVATEKSDFLFALYILSYFREPLAFPHVLKFSQISADWVDKIFGDHITEALGSWLVSTYNGDFQALKNLIENKTAYTFSRSGALQSLLGLYALEKLSREEIIAYLKELIHSDLVEDYEFASAIALCAMRLYPEELYDDIMDLFEKGLIGPFFLSKGSIEKALEMGRKACLEQHVYTRKFNLPITNVIDRVSWIMYEDEHKPDEPSYDEIEPAYVGRDTFVRDGPKIGRNDPCLCGSSKKYKKCCLSASAVS